MKRIFTISGVLLLFLFSVTSAFAQNVTVKGKVFDVATGEPLIGVSVAVKGTTAGTQTDVNGAYTLSTSPTATLTFSYIGYTAKSVAVNSQTTLDVRLQASANELQQVVVVGYGTQRKLDVTGSVASVKGEEISKQSSTNVVSSLQGKVAGVQITNAGGPGSSPQIRIRGLGTVYGNANPLYVVDGVWFDDISFLNSNDIENMSILKDASSESIYGVRAANGVVLITTKKGKGAPSINYSAYAGWQRVTHQPKLATGTEYATLINELNAINAPTDPITFPDVNKFGTGTNWLNDVLRDAFTMKHDISVSGSTDKSTYTFSAGYLKQQGVVKKNDYDRITVHMQQDVQATKFLKLGYNAVLQGSKSTDAPGDVIYKAFTAAPIVPVFYDDGTYGDPGDFPLGNATNNPQAQLDFYNHKSNGYRVTGNMFADIKFAPFLTFHTSFGGEFGQAETTGYLPLYYATSTQNNRAPNHSTLTVTRAEVRNWIWENTLTFDRTIAKDHHLTVLVGQSAQRYKSYNLNASAQDVPYTSSGDLYLRLGSQDTRSIDDSGDLSTYQSFFSRVNYSFKDRYLLNASIRADGSSKFIGDQRWGYFPSVGAGWVISNEEFMKNQQIFDNLKLRGSWGKIGNASVPANLSTQTVNTSAGFTAIYNGAPATGANITAIVPPTTYWERGVGTDVGLEMGFLKSKLTFEADFYNKETQQAIFAIPVLGSLGTDGGTIIGNQATFQNRGFEFTLGWRDNISKDFSYSLNGNLSINSNKVLNTVTGANPIYGGGAAATGGQLSTRTIVGQPIGEYYGLVVTGVFQNAAQVANSLQKADAKPGDFIYKDLNGDKVIDAKDRTAIGNPNPKYLYGFNTTFNYKAFDLSVDFQGVAGVDVYNANKGLRYGAENFTQDFFDNRWHGEGTSTTYPSANVGGGNNYKPNTFFVESGSYFRVRNMQLGYTLPSSIASKLFLKRVRLYANAQNALNFFKYKGFNPEIGGQGDQPGINAGIDNGAYPLYATYNFGINVTF
ncbi:TonB-linked outer membrane protein, SusC/RagA family [Mucilaginibacter pineti]|uniref:TonB-linked outer membrane protein, SusC/RagA family n=1 Tax=Mucilaginibacter pineti TaxID=1391627 RepID=A0A1G7DVC1_9SPHI|nr:TonB-dependent receptor [Mucilaginibacter pineti]SDE55136.1 TonB-linked outer membrane protein, SusC/RagA family [Mucilaginibacter pineti]